MSHTPYKICPECQTRAALAAPYCLTCRRKYNTRFVPFRAGQTLRLPFTVAITPPTKREAAALAQVCGVLLLALGAFCASRAQNETGVFVGFVPAGRVLWSGERLYFSAAPYQTPTLAFVVLGGGSANRDARGPSRIKVRYPNGSDAWMPRETVSRSDNYFVKLGDPALARKTWRVFAY